MERVTNIASRLHRDEGGVTATEYIVLLILIACFVIGVVKTYGETLENKYADATNGVNRLVTF